MTRRIPAPFPGAAEVLRELEAQADRIRAGIACRACQGAGRSVRGHADGSVYWTDCGACRGSGTEEPRES